MASVRAVQCRALVERAAQNRASEMHNLPHDAQKVIAVSRTSQFSLQYFCFRPWRGTKETAELKLSNSALQKLKSKEDF